MSRIMEKDEAHRIIDQMPPTATWDGLMREIYVREAVERGLVDSKAGKVAWNQKNNALKASMSLPTGSNPAARSIKEKGLRH